MKNLIIYISILVVLFCFSCTKYEYKEFNSDNIDTCDIDPGLVANVTINDIASMYSSLEVVHGSIKKFPSTSNYILEAVVISSDEEANFYKYIVLQDASGSIQIWVNEMELYKKFKIGQTVMVKLSTLNVEYNDLYKGYFLGSGLISGSYMGRISSELVDEIIFNKFCPIDVEPVEINITNIDSSDIWKLVKINNIQFIESDTSETFADLENHLTCNRTIEDCSGNNIIVRTSGYAAFAGNELPNGNGSIIGVLGQWGSDIQLYVRKHSEVSMNNTRCMDNNILEKDFEDGSLFSGGWTEQNVIGSASWTPYYSTYGYVGSISNYSGGNTACETWFISPGVDLSNSVEPFLIFDNTWKYLGDPLIAYVSTDYIGTGSPTSATWTELSFTQATGVDWNFVSSDTIYLSAYKSTSTYIAFKYVGSDNDGSTWQLDNIKIMEK